MFDAKKYWDERLSANYNLVGVGDISLTMNYNKWSYKVTRQVLKGLLVKYNGSNPNKRVLDIGSGTGFVVSILQKLGKQVTGADISATAVKKLQEQFSGYDFIECNVGSDRLPQADGTFSCCTAASVLYHIVDDKLFENALQNIHRVLEKDGIFIFSDNFIHSTNLNITHQKCRTLEEYEQALRRNGFEIVDRVLNYVLFNDPVDTNKKFYPRIWSVNTSWSRKHKWFDSIIWPLLYPVERLLVSTRSESPAQEFMICRAIKN